jgi:hypothetical protein
MREDLSRLLFSTVRTAGLKFADTKYIKSMPSPASQANGIAQHSIAGPGPLSSILQNPKQKSKCQGGLSFVCAKPCTVPGRVYFCSLKIRAWDRSGATLGLSCNDVSFGLRRRRRGKSKSSKQSLKPSRRLSPS